MKAPDKIYINNYNGNDTWGNQWHSKPSQSPSVVSHEYIRKDALLEWAMEKKERLGKMFDAMPATAIGAKLDACKEFIDKIESL